MTTKQLNPMWKVICICALSLLAITAAVFTSYAIYQSEKNNYERQKNVYIEYSNDRIVIKQVRRGYEQLYKRTYDRVTDKPISEKFDWFASECSEGDSLVVYADMKNRRGYLNLNTGKIIIKGAYKHAWNFSEGLGAVVVDDKVGFINPQGEWVIPCQFTVSRNAINNVGFAFHDSLCVMTNENDLCGLINQSGEWVLQPQYDRIWNPNKAHQRIYQHGGKFGIMDLYGNLLIPATYDEIQEEDGVYQVITNGVMSTMDYSFHIINPFVCTGTDVVYLPRGEYEEEISSEEFVKYYINQREGIMNANGKVIIPAIYYYVRMVSEHLFKAQRPNSDIWVFYDTNGNIVNPAQIK